MCYCNNFLINSTQFIDLYAKYPEEVTGAAVFCGVHVRRRRATLPCQETSAWREDLGLYIHGSDLE